MKTVPITK